MPEKKKLLILTYGNFTHASSRIRAVNYIPYLEEEGWMIKWLPRIPEPKNGVLNKMSFVLKKRLFIFQRLIHLFFFNYDLLLVQRMFLPLFFLKILKWKKTPFIYDFDDAIYLGDPKNAANTEEMVKNAAAIIVSNDELAEYSKKFNHKIIEEIPSPVNTERILPSASDERNKIIIGWIGSPWTEKYLNLVKNVFENLHDRNSELMIVGGTGSFKINNIPVKNETWSYDKEVHYLNKMDIGIMPLPNDEWSRGKGGYKLFLYMAAGLPVIASPVGINKEIVENGINGYLASSEEEWLNYINKLIEDKDLRKTLGANGRKKAEELYSYNKNAGKLLQVMNRVITE